MFVPLAFYSVLGRKVSADLAYNLEMFHINNQENFMLSTRLKEIGFFLIWFATNNKVSNL